jgi:hypothetical protein
VTLYSGCAKTLTFGIFFLYQEKDRDYVEEAMQHMCFTPLQREVVMYA